MENNLGKKHETHIFIPAMAQTSFVTLKNMLTLIGS